MLRKDIKHPDCSSLFSDVKIKFKHKFLELNDLKIGDKIQWSFSHQIIRHSNISTTSTEMYGTLKEDEKGFLFIESDETLLFAWYEMNGRSGTAARELRKCEHRKAVFYFLSHIN